MKLLCEDSFQSALRSTDRLFEEQTVQIDEGNVTEEVHHVKNVRKNDKCENLNVYLHVPVYSSERFRLNCLSTLVK